MNGIQHPLDDGRYMGISQVADALGINYETARKLMELAEFPTLTLYAGNLARLVARYEELERFVMDRHNWYALNISKIQHPRLRILAQNTAELSPKVWMSIHEAASFLAMTKYGVEYHVRTGSLKPKTYCNRHYFLVADVKRFKNRLAKAGPFLNQHKGVKLNKEAVKQMRQMRADGVMLKDIVEQFGISSATAIYAIGGRTWRHVPFPPGTEHLKHKGDPSNHAQKLTRRDAEEIIDLLWHGAEPASAIAERYGVSVSLVYSIASGKVWSGLERPPVYARPKGEDIPHAKLTEGDVREIRRRMANGATGTSLARKYGVEPTTIYTIYKCKSWKHVH